MSHQISLSDESKASIRQPGQKLACTTTNRFAHTSCIIRSHTAILRIFVHSTCTSSFTKVDLT